MIEHAVDYVGKGWPVFPCDPRNKRPHPILGAEGGFHHATLDEAKVRAWWELAPDALIGSAASFAIDIDTPEGMESARRLALSRGAVVRTGNGWHAHFGPIPRLRARGTVAGLTIRAVNRAYVILPPSRHPSGAVYRWVNVPEAPRLADLPQLPAAALDVIAPPLEPMHRLRPVRPLGSGTVTEGLRRHVDEVLERVRQAPEGQRHPTAVAAAVHLARVEAERGLAPGTFRAEVEEAALASGLDAEEVRGNGYRKGIADWAWEAVA